MNVLDSDHEACEQTADALVEDRRLSEQSVDERPSTEPFVKTASAPYTTAMIISGNNQNFFRMIAKRQS